MSLIVWCYVTMGALHCCGQKRQGDRCPSACLQTYPGSGLGQARDCQRPNDTETLGPFSRSNETHSTLQHAVVDKPFSKVICEQHTTRQISCAISVARAHMLFPPQPDASSVLQSLPFHFSLIRSGFKMENTTRADENTTRNSYLSTQLSLFSGSLCFQL